MTILIPRWIKIRRRFIVLPRYMRDTMRTVWWCYVWEVEDSANEEFMGLTPEHSYFENESAARAAYEI